MGLTVEHIEDAAALRAMLRFPRRVYRGDRRWVPPPPGELERRLDVRRNPLWAEAERALFVVRSGGEVVGTIAAIAERPRAGHAAQVGRFGFFEAIDDAEVAALLADAAASWLRARGMRAMRGPYNGAVTDETGVLIEGIRTRPALWEAYSPTYYRGLLEGLGFAKHDDVLAYELETADAAAATAQARLSAVAARLSVRTRITLRELRLSAWDREVALVCSLYNRSFHSTPGHEPISGERFADLARRIKPLIDPSLMLVAELDGTAIGFAVGLRDANPALAALRGRGDPLSLLRFRWTLARTRTLCVKLLGVLPEHRGRGVDVLLMEELWRRARARGFTCVEMSLVSERNLVMRRGLERLGARVARTYRVFQRNT